MPKSLVLSSAIAGLALVVVTTSQANERHFTYTTETATLPQGGSEIEIWNTARLGKTDFYSRLDQRVEFEVGVTDKLQASLYLNWNSITSLETAGLEHQFNWEGFSTEIKYKQSDASADALGSALYGEFTYQTDALEFEGKGLVDKRVGDWLFAANLIGSMEVESEFKQANALDRDVEWDTKGIEGEVDLAASYEIKPGLTTGLELRNHHEWTKNNDTFEYEHSALFLGPTLAYATKAWWVAFSVLPQLPALKPEGDSNFALESEERMQARLLFSLHL